MDIITSRELKEIGEIIEIPFFSDGSKIAVKVRKPDLITMMIDNKIPNPLIEVALNMTENGKVDLYKDKEKPEDKDEIDMEKTRKWIMFLREIAKESLVSPTYDEFVKNGIALNSNQLLEIYKYAVGEANALKSFRNE